VTFPVAGDGEMKYRQLGRCGLQISPLCVGTVNFGWVTSAEEGFAILDRALEGGINFIDTANSYNHVHGDASSESIIGRWLRLGEGRRRKVVLATKVFRGLSDWPNDGRLCARHIKQACEDSLRRLSTDHIDLYQMHHVDRTTPWEEVWQALDQLVREGKVIYVGSSNFAAWHIATCQGVARQRQLLGLVSEQSPYNLSQRWTELEVLPACHSLGLGFLAYSPFAGGALTGRTQEEGGRRSQPEVQRLRQRLAETLISYETFCTEAGYKQTAVALAWVLHQPGVSAAVVGPRTRSQINELLEDVLKVELDEGMLRRLDEIWPGPGGPAPEAYAW
jgi:aryl-alcohol dehydrogenase-like predicted oxidoreductase